MNETPQLGDMDLEDFRKYGYQLVDWAADYLANPQRYDVLAKCKPGEVKARLASAPPERGDSFDEIIEDFTSVIVPGMTHWNHPDFFAYFGISASGPGILGELLCSVLNANGMLWRTSPAATELEQLTLDWLRQLLGLDAELQGTIVDTASIACLLALAAAREKLGLDIRQRGMTGRELPRLRVYTSDQAHSSIDKTAITLGIGQQGIRKIPCNSQFQMKADALAAAIRDDLADGWQPWSVVATVGTTSTTSIDPVADIARICDRHGLWLHVDAAYGGIAAAVPELRHILSGCERADSMVVNPHKWLFTPLDCSALYVRDPQNLQRAFSLVPEYLSSREQNVTNYMDWGLQLGRRFRALKLWMVMRYFGQQGLVARIREHIRLAAEFAAWVDASPDFERLAPTPLSTVCFRTVPAELKSQLRDADPIQHDQLQKRLDTLNEQLVDTVNESGRMFLSHTRLHGRYTIRLAIGNIRSLESNVKAAWERIRDTAASLA